MYSLQWSWDLKMCIYLLERCPHFRGCYVQSSIELGPEDVYIPIREVSSFQRVCEVEYTSL